MVLAEITGLRPRGQKQVVVTQDFPMGTMKAPALELDPDHFTQKYLNRLVGAQDDPDGFGNLRRRKGSRGHLIEQWLKEVVILPIDDRHLHAALAQSLCGLQSGKAGADDHHMRGFTMSRASLDHGRGLRRLLDA